MPLDLSALEQRLRRLEDRDAIHQIFIDYGRHLDNGDWDAYAALFAEDAEVLLGPMGRAKGRAAIRELMATKLTSLVGTTYHVISSPAVELAGDTATAEVMWTVLERRGDGSPAVSMVGSHRDTLVRRNGRWQLLRRAGHMSLAAGYTPA